MEERKGKKEALDRQEKGSGGGKDVQGTKLWHLFRTGDMKEKGRNKRMKLDAGEKKEAGKWRK